MIKLNIKPLSINKAFQGRRYKTVDYNNFERDMLLILPKYNFDIKANLKLIIKYGFSSKLADLDNPAKLTIDCLCKKYGFDDRQIFELNQTKEIVKKGHEYIAFKIENYEI